MSVSSDSSSSRISPAVAAGRWALALPKRGVLLAIAIYQRTLSPVWPAVFGPNCGCRFYPTCSHYAAQAVGRHGALVGAWLALVRVLKCTPLHPGGVDEVPPKPLRRPSCARVAS